MTSTLVVIATVAGSAAAGALLVGMFVILPLLLSLPVDRYPAVNGFVLVRMDKLMPATVAVAVLSGGALALTLPDPAQRAVYAAGAILLAGVAAVSIFALGPINRAVQAIDPVAPRPDWSRLRRTWRDRHLIRVALGQAGAFLYAVGLAWVL